MSLFFSAYFARKRVNNFSAHGVYALVFHLHHGFNNANRTAVILRRFYQHRRIIGQAATAISEPACRNFAHDRSIQMRSRAWPDNRGALQALWHGKAAPDHWSSSQAETAGDRSSPAPRPASISDISVWQLEVLPSVDAYWGATPTECVPFLGKDVSSMISQASSPPTCASASVSKAVSPVQMADATDCRGDAVSSQGRAAMADATL